MGCTEGFQSLSRYSPEHNYTEVKITTIHCTKSTHYRHKNMLFDVDIPSDSDSSSDTTSKYQQLQEEQEMKDILSCVIIVFNEINVICYNNYTSNYPYRARAI